MKISDETVEVAQAAWTKAYWTEAKPGRPDWMRAALEAAVPYLTPGREALEKVLREFGHEEDGGGWVLFADDIADIADAVLSLWNGGER